VVAEEAVLLRILQELIFVVQPGPCAGAEANREQATDAGVRLVFRENANSNIFPLYSNDGMHPVTIFLREKTKNQISMRLCNERNI
jgi:hypothetical protein